jgi:hypothetical protein
MADLDEVPGPSMPFALVPAGGPLIADGRTVQIVRTDQLRDAHGNVLLDGTAVRLVVDAPGGRRVASAITIDGRAEFNVAAPAAPGPVRLAATTDGASSAPLQLDYRAAVSAWPARLVHDGPAWAVEVGPVPLIDGGWVPDGTEVVLADGAAGVVGVIDAGVARLPLASIPSEAARLTILGVTSGLDR